MQLRRLLVAHKWFVVSLLLLGVFAIFTFIFSTGILLYPTLYVERWLLHRPLTGIDCVFGEWKQLGEVGFSLFFTLVLGVVCLVLGYRRRILPLLFCLLLLGVGAEYVGKQIFPQIIPINTQFGTPSLACPQLRRETRSERLMGAVGMWWKPYLPILTVFKLSSTALMRPLFLTKMPSGFMVIPVVMLYAGFSWASLPAGWSGDIYKSACCVCY